MKKTLSSLAAAAVFLSGLPGLSGAMSFSATAEETSASVVAAFSSAPSIILSESGAKTCSPGEILTFSAFISNEAVYNLSVTYINAVSEDTVLSLKIDGELPFAEADNLRFPTGWINGNPPAADRFGNETVPEQVMDSDPSTLCARDFAGASELPYLLTFAAGTHEITLTVRQGEWIPVTVSLTPPEQPEAYKVPESPPEIP
ncbi:MAG: hypothetical protein LBQ48_05410, partial [Oscillospiraceae bacterium]|nr:hypothetical protein [Oscillospiraceae bacterium]